MEREVEGTIRERESLNETRREWSLSTIMRIFVCFVLIPYVTESDESRTKESLFGSFRGISVSG